MQILEVFSYSVSRKLRANIRWVLLGKYVTVIIIVALLGFWIEQISIPPSQPDDDTGGGESTTDLSRPL